MERTLEAASFSPVTDGYYYGKDEFSDIKDSRTAVVNEEIKTCVRFDALKKECGACEFSADRKFVYTACNFSARPVHKIYYLFVDFWEMKVVAFNNFAVIDSCGYEYKTQFYRSLRGLYIAVDAILMAHEQKEFYIIPRGQLSSGTSIKNINLIRDYTKDFLRKDKSFRGTFYNVRMNKYGVCGIKSTKDDIVAGNICCSYTEGGQKIKSVLDKIILKNSGEHLSQFEFTYIFNPCAIKKLSITYTFYKNINLMEMSVSVIKDVSRKTGKMQLEIPFASLKLIDEYGNTVTGVINIKKGVSASCGKENIVFAVYDTDKAEYNNNKLIFPLFEADVQNGYSESVIEEFRFAAALSDDENIAATLDELDRIDICVRGERK